MKCNGRTCNNEALPGLKVCERCRKWRNEYHQKRRERTRAHRHCSVSDCPNTPEPGYKVCARCRKRIQEYEDSIRPELRRKHNDYYQSAKKEVFAHYGLACACCGESKVEFLGIDHENGEGASHRREIGRSIYLWLRANNFPTGFRTMCHNCNFALGHYGYCPHNNGLTQTVHTGRPRKERRSQQEAAGGTVLVPIGS